MNIISWADQEAIIRCARRGEPMTSIARRFNLPRDLVERIAG